jgi:hypothetical protein
MWQNKQKDTGDETGAMAGVTIHDGHPITAFI